MSIKTGTKVKVKVNGWHGGKSRNGWYVGTVARVYETANLGMRVDVNTKSMGLIDYCDPQCVKEAA